MHELEEIGIKKNAMWELIDHLVDLENQIVGDSYMPSEIRQNRIRESYKTKEKIVEMLISEIQEKHSIKEQA